MILVASAKAPWRGTMASDLENIAVDYSDRAAFFAIDADKSKKTVGPSLLLVKDGKRRVVPIAEGRSEAELRALIEGWLKPSKPGL